MHKLYYIIGRSNCNKYDVYNKLLKISKFHEYDPNNLSEINNYDLLGIGTIDKLNSLRKKLKDQIVPIYLYSSDRTCLNNGIKSIPKTKNWSSDEYSELCKCFLLEKSKYSKKALQKVGITYYNKFNLDICTVEDVSQYIAREIKKEKVD